MSPAVHSTPTSSSPAVLFDFDGTVGRSLHLWTEAMRIALAHHEIEMSHDEVIEYCFNRPFEQTIERYNIPCSKTFRDMIWKEVAELMHGVELFQGVQEVVSLLRSEGYRTAIVTNSRRSVVSPVLDRHGISSLFDTVIGEEDVRSPKPDPEPVLRALEELRSPPEHSWMIGDSDADIFAGKNAGTTTIGFAPNDNLKYSPLHRLKDADPHHIIDTYQDLPGIIFGRE